MKRADKVREADRLTRRGFDLEERGKIREAIKVYQEAAEMGDVSAMANLANLLDDKVRPARSKEAVYWHKRAARRRHWVGAFNLAMHYRNLGQRRWQIHWLKVAIKLGDPDAKAELRKLK